MSDSDITGLGRFLQRDDGRSVSAVRADERAAGLVADQFAREAVLALRQFEQTYPPTGGDNERRLAERFGQLWNQAGLDRVNWDAGEASDAQRILVAAAELANSPSGRLSLGDATARARMGGRLNHTPDRMQRELDDAYGSHFEAPDAPVWLRESLGRLAKACVVRDLVGSGTKTKVASQVAQTAEQVVSQANQLSDARRTVSQDAGSLGAAAAKTSKANKQAWAYNGVIFVTAIPDLPLAADIARWVPAAYLAARLGIAANAENKAENRLSASQRGAQDTRAQLAGTLDKMPRPGDSLRKSRGGGGAGR